MDVGYFPGTIDEYNRFHAMNRVVYYVLAFKLWHDPLVSLHILALWLWLEQFGFKNFVESILSMPHSLVDEFASEAITCLSCLRNCEILVPAEALQLPWTSKFLKRKLLPVLIENGDVVLCGISEIIEVCVTILQDLIDDATMKHKARELLHRMKIPSSVGLEESLVHKFANLGFGGHNWSTSRNANSMHQGETSKGTVAGLQNLRCFGRDLSSRNGGLNIPNSTLPPDERSMFVTFSKGFPVSKGELLYFFSMVFEDCIESVHMQQVRSNEQALYAQVVLRFPFVIDLLLNGVAKAKYTINGKYLWMRKFVSKLTNSRHTASSGSSSALVPPPVYR